MSQWFLRVIMDFWTSVASTAMADVGRPNDSLGGHQWPAKWKIKYQNFKGPQAWNGTLECPWWSEDLDIQRGLTVGKATDSQRGPDIQWPRQLGGGADSQRPVPDAQRGPGIQSDPDSWEGPWYSEGSLMMTLAVTGAHHSQRVLFSRGPRWSEGSRLSWRAFLSDYAQISWLLWGFQLLPPELWPSRAEGPRGIENPKGGTLSGPLW